MCALAWIGFAVNFERQGSVVPLIAWFVLTAPASLGVLLLGSGVNQMLLLAVMHAVPVLNGILLLRVFLLARRAIRSRATRAKQGC
jgi:hypothetical protein